MAKSLPHIAVPLLRPEDVIPHLGKPTHWKQGRSAKAVADSWFYANSIPEPVRNVLDQANEYRGAILIDAWLERCVDLGDGGRPTQTDLMAVLGIGARLSILAVEAKVDESFGPTVDKWLAEEGDGKLSRLEMLCELFGLSFGTVRSMRYQFLHRTASAILEARRYRATDAVMLVQSFCPKDSGLEDFRAFFGAAGFNGFDAGRLSEAKTVGGIRLRIGWVRDKARQGYSPRQMTVKQLTELGRVRLSKSFFMRDMLHSEIAQVHGLLNAPDDADLAIAAGTRLCADLLEPLQDRFGALAIRSAYRSREVNALGNAMQKAKKPGYTCASNAANAAKHIWDMRDADGCMGAMACVVVPSAYDAHPEAGGWQVLARWIHDNLPYSTLYFFPTYWAVNIGWHERPKRRIDSYAEPKGRWVPG